MKPLRAWVQLVLLLSVCLPAAGYAEEDGSSAAAAKIRAELGPLFPGDGEVGTAPDRAGPEVTRYLRRYGLEFPESWRHRLGVFTSTRYTLAGQIVEPPNARGTVLLLHGLFDHTGTLAFALRHFASGGYTVAAFDLPGHGLSSGTRASVGSFEHYDRALDTFIANLHGDVPTPIHAVAHSTGAAIVATRLLERPDRTFDRVALIAPLVHSAHWEVSTRAARALGRFVEDVPRVYRDNTSDEAFAARVRDDPLQARKASLEWVEALVRWNERIEALPPSDRALLIVQGDSDSVVDWEFNLPFLREKFPRARVVMVPGGRHQLLGERHELKRQVMQAIDEELTGHAATAREGNGNARIAPKS